MARKGLFIVFLIAILTGFFYFRIYFKNEVQEPRLQDRIPIGDYMGKIKVLDVARELTPFLFYNKIPFRDFLSKEFLLAQGKNYGIDLQKPALIFVNESGEWGALIALSDSTKIQEGYARLRKEVEIKDTMVGAQRLLKMKNEKIYITHGKRWLFLYRGKQLPKRMYDVIYAKYGEIKKPWKEFLTKQTFKGENILLCSSGKRVKSYGFEEVIFAQDSDSIQMHVKMYARAKTDLGLMKKESGLSFSNDVNSSKTISLHLKTEGLANATKHPLVIALTQLGKRIGFPTQAFLEAWEGDLCFQEGGLQKVKEKYIETVMDEEFNTVEVERVRDQLVPRYALLLSMNENQNNFVSKLFAKGILTKTNEQYRLLASPPLRIYQKSGSLLFYSTDHAPKVVQSSGNWAKWEHRKTAFSFHLDSIHSKTLFFSADFPILGVLKLNK